ncbi:hypothetical protein H3Z85_09530 [Chryseobacterium indologenes]|uniref:hypothetical protein n=1 Tax=Chryseobacterium indologenes TaxID=253 RepID=UPI0003E06A2F|nr:hypothetical protein [Chryseobacterium indologenes]QPQ53536.1 hypothetical protein H3Z85_09530 [Chryseobacterium indologenes]GAE63870.1 hypothetical protein CIN01S_04_04780 [Chryseobacterium indologenes NBRC 14944]SUX52404.1 Uncharacterised protein [Chryseobacterium indologenes]
MNEICKERELLSTKFFALADQEIGDKNIDLRAVSALVVAGVYNLVLHAKSTDSCFCDIDINKLEGFERIKTVISTIIKKTYSGT